MSEQEPTPTDQPQLMDDGAWRGFMSAGDSWLIAYAVLATTDATMFVFGPIAFAAGHFAELYLKAAHAKLLGDWRATVSRRHKLQVLLSEIQKKDPSFLPDYELRPAILELPNLDLMAVFEKFGPEGVEHAGVHQELYQVARVLVDLKYIWSPSDKVTGNLGLIAPNDYWTGFAREVRAHLGWPPADVDGIVDVLKRRALPPRAIDYLLGIYNA